jgi:hypothetical protein
MNGNAYANRLSAEAAADLSEIAVDPSDRPSAPRRAAYPAWLRVSDLEALVQRFAPLDLGHAHHVALVLHEGSTPVDMLILRLVTSGLAPCEARRFIAEVRDLRQQRLRPRVAPCAATLASNFAAAREAAAGPIRRSTT